MSVDPAVLAALLAIFWPVSQYVLAALVFVAFFAAAGGLAWAYELRRAR